MLIGVICTCSNITRHSCSLSLSTCFTTECLATVVHSRTLQVVQPAADGAAAGGLRPDAGVNAANALCSWAELVQAPQRAELLQQAVELYRAALAQEEDAAVRLQTPHHARCMGQQHTSQLAHALAGWLDALQVVIAVVCVLVGAAGGVYCGAGY
jgi:hypothetical protein